MYYRTDLYEGGRSRCRRPGRTPRRGVEAQGDVRVRDDRRQRRLAVPRRLVLPVHHDGRRVDERQRTTQDFEPNLTRKSVRALQHMIDCAVSPGVTSYGFTESVDAFSVGNVGQMILLVDDRRLLYDPESQVSDTVAAVAVRRRGSDTGPCAAGGVSASPTTCPRERKDVRLAPADLPHVAGVRAVPGLTVQDRSEPQLDGSRGPGPRRGTPLSPRRRRGGGERQILETAPDPGELRARRRGGPRVQPRAGRVADGGSSMRQGPGRLGGDPPGVPVI